MHAPTAFPFHPLLRVALWVGVFVGGGFFLLLAAGAFAAGPIGPTSLAPISQAATIDFGPLVSQLLTVAAGIVGTLLLALLAMIQKRLGISADADANRHLHEGLQRGVDAALVWADRELAGRTKIEVRDSMVAFAVGRAVRLLPGVLRHFGITEVTLQELVREKVERAIDVRLVPEDGGWAPPPTLGPKPLR